MRIRRTFVVPALCLLAFVAPMSFAAAQESAASVAVANDNRHPAGAIEAGVLTIDLEIRRARWYPDADGGNSLLVLAFAEAGHAPSVPAPLLRATAATPMRVTVTNTLDTVALVYGLHGHPVDAASPLEVPPNATREAAFVAGDAGTHHYYAVVDPEARGQLRMGAPDLPGRWSEDGALSGAFIIDEPGATAADRVWVLNIVSTLDTPTTVGHEVLTINGKAWPYTERVMLAEGEPVRWRVVNSTPSEHPMHLHGAYFDVLGVGDENAYVRYEQEQVRTVVTEYVLAGGTFDMRWTPPAPGGWLFHCHYTLHMVPELAVPATASAALPDAEAGRAATHATSVPALGMGGLVLAIDVTPRALADAPTTEQPRRLVRLTVESGAPGTSASGSIVTTLYDAATGARTSGSPGPPLVVTRGEPLQVDVENLLTEATSIHWHGLELESYFDGVPGIGGASRSVTPPVAPGQTFAARMAPPRAGTFIYHTHMGHDTQLEAGLYGPMIVLEPGRSFDPAREKILLIGAAESDWETAEIRLNGEKNPPPLQLQTGERYRLRVINISPNLDVAVTLGEEADALQWRALAKDGFELPEAQRLVTDARLKISVGETYDFEFVPVLAGDFPLVVENLFNPEGRIERLLRVRDALPAQDGSR